MSTQPDYCREEFDKWYKQDNHRDYILAGSAWAGWCAALENADCCYHNKTSERQWMPIEIGWVPAGHAVLVTALPKKDKP